MTNLFFKILNMSLSASVVILAVLLLRALLHRAPKRYRYMLWSVVAFRLCCPVSWESVFSLFSLKLFGWATKEPIRAGGISLSPQPQIPSMPSGTPTTTPVTPNVPVTPTTPVTPSVPVTPVVPPVTDSVTDGVGAVTTPVTEAVRLTANITQILLTAAIVLWCVGIAALLIYGIVGYIKMKRRLRTAVRLEEDVYLSEHVRSPFILGFIRPRIYIPYGLSGDTLRYVLAHERYHKRRFDYLIKPFAFLLLAIHWFNPLCWLAFHLMSRDMEMSCDEKVLSEEKDIAPEYSMSLLSFAEPHSFPSPGPLCFGESSVGSRVKNALRWKKPKVYITVICAVLCVTAIAACVTDPAERDKTAEDSDGTEVSGSTDENKIPSMIPRTFLGEWHTEDYDIIPCRITVTGITVNQVFFNIFDKGLFGINFIAKKVDGEIVFAEQTPLYENGISGKILFEDDGITVIYENFGDYQNMPATPYIMEFPIKIDPEDTESAVTEPQEEIPMPTVKVPSDSPLYDFLTDEQVKLFYSAKNIYMHLFGCDTSDVTVWDDTMHSDTRGEIGIDGRIYMKAGGPYASYADFDRLVHSVFTDSFWQSRNITKGGEGPNYYEYKIYTEADGALCFIWGSRGFGPNSEYPDEYRLDYKSEDRINFTVIGHYFENGGGYRRDGERVDNWEIRLRTTYDYTVEYPITMVRTVDGWRFDTFYDSLYDEQLMSLGGDSGAASEPDPSYSDTSIYAALPKNFGHSSGVGAWHVDIELADDGSFTGEYRDYDMGVTGEGYPHGTAHTCSFEGKFSGAKKIDDFTYEIRLETVRIHDIPGTFYYEDDMRFINEDIDWLFDSEDVIQIYLPGRPFDDPQDDDLTKPGWEFKMWMGTYKNMDAYDAIPDGYYGIYNVTKGRGFVGSK